MNAKINFLIVCLVLFSIIGQIRFLDDIVGMGDEVQMHINVNNRNHADKDLDDIKTKIIVYETGDEIESASFDIEEDETKGKFIVWNAPSNKGEYLLRIVTSNDDKREVKHRYIVVG